jgi:hypothetical protein
MPIFNARHHGVDGDADQWVHYNEDGWEPIEDDAQIIELSYESPPHSTGMSGRLTFSFQGTRALPYHHPY